MNTNKKTYGIFTSSLIIAAIIFTAIPINAQDLVPVSDITGGSSVFVFRKAAAATRRFSSTAKATRTKAQRLETVTKIRKQYDTIAKVKPTRVRTTVVDPENLPPSVRTMPREQASKLFAGVGEYYIDRKEIDKSVDFFRQAISFDGKNTKAKDGLSDALAVKGNDLLVNDNAAEAKAFFQEALKNNSKNAAAYFGLGQVLSDLDQSAEAIASYEKALAADPGLTEIYQPLGILYYQAGEIAKADDLLTKALAKSSESAETQTFLGEIRFSQNRNPEALAALQRAQTLDPKYPEAWLRGGDVLMRLNRPNEAIASYQKAVALRANYFDAWQGLGAANYKSEDYTAAIDAFKQATRLKNDNADAFLGLADAQRMAGNYNEAAGSYNLATLFMSRGTTYSKDEQADAYSKIGYVLGQQCKRNMRNAIPCQWPSAIKALEKAVELGGGNTADYANLGWAYYNAARIDFNNKLVADGRAKLELAKTNLQKAAAANPTFVEGPLLNLGMTLTDTGDFAGAVDALSKVVKKQPKWVFAWNELGIAYRKQNNFKDAATQFRKAVDIDDKFAEAHYNLGETLIRDGKIDDAKKEYQKLKKLGRNDLAVPLEAMSGGLIRK